jgi:hypothetical protein
MAPRQPRTRPVLTVTVKPENLERLKELVTKIPGGKLSGVVDEMLTLTLPIFEQVVQAFVRAQREDGTTDPELARQHLEAYIGATLFKMYNSAGFLTGEGDEST